MIILGKIMKENKIQIFKRNRVNKFCYSESWPKENDGIKLYYWKLRKYINFFLFQKYYFQKHKSWILCSFLMAMFIYS